MGVSDLLDRLRDQGLCVLADVVSTAQTYSSAHLNPLLPQFPGAGRGLQTKESIPYGTELFREVPMLAIPSFSHAEQVCALILFSRTMDSIGSIGPQICCHWHS